MDFIQQELQWETACAEIYRYGKGSALQEFFAMLHVKNQEVPFEEQLKYLTRGAQQLLHELGQEVTFKIAFKRYFLSDAANQETLVMEQECSGEGAVSIVEQPPLDGTKVALWIYGVAGAEVECKTNGFCEVCHDGLRHLWLAHQMGQGENSETQTLDIFNHYIHLLGEENCTLRDNCIRTWFFVHDVDNNYAGMVRARNTIFAGEGLTDQTHFLASTGIAGRSGKASSLVLMDAYAVQGLKPGQVHYLYASDHLNRTSEYGVSFERGTYIDLADRRKIFISGTASIDSRGEILYRGDIRRQVVRMWENVETLLQEAEANFDHVGQMIVYLRDMADYCVVSQMFRDRFPGKPMVIVLAPVCRPGWLVEMECIAVKGL